MSIKFKCDSEIKVTPDIVAHMFWSMDSNEQASFFDYLGRLTTSYDLHMQAIAIREACKEESNLALDAYLTLFSGAYKYMGDV